MRIALEKIEALSWTEQSIERELTMRKRLNIIAQIFLVFVCNLSIASDDSRQLIELPEMMQEHLLANMRDHLVAINEILIYLADDKLDEAADVAESRLGMCSLKLHGASHMAKLMPAGMQQMGTSMHRAASRFALKAEEGDVSSAYSVLTEVTSACVACQSNYRIR